MNCDVRLQEVCQSQMNKPHTEDEELLMLGLPDAEIAKLRGCSRQAVQQARKIRGIESKRAKKFPDIKREDLEGMSTSEVAEKYAVCVSTAQLWFRRLEIEPFAKKRDRRLLAFLRISDEELVGTHYQVLMAQYGVSQCIVHGERCRRGFRKYYKIDWSKWDHLHDTMTVQEMADVIGCVYQTVQQRRKKLAALKNG
jgi:hypothetical protein